MERPLIGDALGMFFLFFASLAIGLLVEVVALAKALPMLVQRPNERSPINLFCAALGVAFVFACIAIAASFYVAVHKT